LETLVNKVENISEPLPKGKSFSKETLFVKGENSKYVQDSDMEDIKKHFPSAEIEVVENAGHWLHAENPEVFFDVVMRFLRE
jgi:pimeloyl-ACP methyl ester carboxylesterase